MKNFYTTLLGIFICAGVYGQTITNVATTDPTCGNNNGTITITATGGTAPLQYSIDNGVTFQAGNSFAGLSNGTYDIVVEDAVGSQATTQVTLTDLGTPSITSATTTDPTCGNNNGTITITATGTAPLQYSNDNGITFQAGNSFAGLSNGTYDIFVEDAFGCQATTQVTLTDLGTPSITNAATTDPTCGNNNGTITITATGGTAPLQYSIDNGVTFQAGNNFVGFGNGTYDIVVEDAVGCQATTQVTLTNLGTPSITNAATTDPTCGNNNGTITITATGGTAPLQYSIDNGVTFQAGNSFAGLSNGTYDIFVEDAVGCQATTQVTLTGNALPDVTLTIVTNLLTANNVNTGVTYQWLDCNNNYSILLGETAQSYVITTSGNYAVEVTENGCIDTSVCNSMVFVGIEENSFENEHLVYPNPTNGNFSIDLGETYSTVTITMIDLNGKLIESKKYNKSQLLNLKLEDPAGVYLLMIESEEKKTIIRLVKE